MGQLLDYSVVIIGVTIFGMFSVKLIRHFYYPHNYTDKIQRDYLDLLVYRRYRKHGYNAFKIPNNCPIISNIKGFDE